MANASTVNFATISEALVDIRNGKFVIVLDDENRENEGDLIMAAELATPELVAFCVNNTTGILCAPMTASRANELQLPIMVHANHDPNRTAFTVTTDSIDTSTGVSASDRAITFKQLADPMAKACKFRRPGHIFPLIARPGGVLERPGHTEAAVDLCKLAGLSSVGLIGELVNKDGGMKRLHDAAVFGSENNIRVITIEQLKVFILRNKDNIVSGFSPKKITEGIELVAHCEIPIKLHGKDLGYWTLKCYFSHFDGCHHISLERGDISREAYDPVLTRIHSECFTGDTLGSQRCDCGEQLFKSLEMILHRGRGVVIYNVGHEGRGIGLANKILAYHLQQTWNMDTYAANHALGFPDDLRNYNTARAIIKHLGIEKIQLVTNNKTKLAHLKDLVSSTVPIEVTTNHHNKSYLDAKWNKQNGCTEPSSIRTSPKILEESPRLNGEVDPVASAVASPAQKFRTAPPGNEVKSLPVNIPVPPISITSTLKIGIVRTCWNENLIVPFKRTITKQLVQGKIDPQNITEISVPGSFEIPWAAKSLVASCDAIICIGLLIKGETTHFEMISESAAHAMMNIQLESGVPVVNSVFNCLTEGQAKARCGPESPLSASLAASTIYMAALKKGWKPIGNI